MDLAGATFEGVAAMYVHPYIVIFSFVAAALSQTLSRFFGALIAVGVGTHLLIEFYAPAGRDMGGLFVERMIAFAAWQAGGVAILRLIGPMLKDEDERPS